MNRTLETRVQTRTLELAERNRDMHTLLDNVEEGLLTLSPAGIMAMEHSAILDRWFGPYGVDTSLSAYLERTSPTFSAYLSVAWEALAAGFLPLEVCIEQLPKHIEARGSTWHVRYTPIMSSGQLSAVLVVIRDMTAELARPARGTSAEGPLERVSEIDARSRWLYGISCRDDGQRRRRVQWPARRGPADFQANRYTIKGNAGIFGLEQLEALCHRIEEEMIETSGPAGAIVDR